MPAKLPPFLEPFKLRFEPAPIARGGGAVGRGRPVRIAPAVVVRSAADVVTEGIHAVLQRFHASLTAPRSAPSAARPTPATDRDVAALPLTDVQAAAAQKVLVAARKAAKVEQMRAYARQGALTASERFKATNGISPI